MDGDEGIDLVLVVRLFVVVACRIRLPQDSQQQYREGLKEQRRTCQLGSSKRRKLCDYALGIKMTAALLNVVVTAPGISISSESGKTW